MRPVTSSPSIASLFRPREVAAELRTSLEDFVARFTAGLERAVPSTAALSSRVAALDVAQAPRKKTKTEVVVASFNVLGSSHTRAGGNKPGYASGPARMHQAVKALRSHEVDVVGFQEFERDQAHEFKKLTGDDFGVFPGQRPHLRSVNSLAWNRKEWKLVKADTVKVPYFNGKLQEMPVVLLQNRATGQKAFFANFHNPASTRRFPNQERFRDRATEIEIDLVHRLRRKTGLPVFVTGDMNERQEVRDRFARRTDLHDAQRAAHDRASKRVGIDWIFGGGGVRFTDFDRDQRVQRRRVSDHPLVVANAVIRG